MSTCFGENNRQLGLWFPSRVSGTVFLESYRSWVTGLVFHVMFSPQKLQQVLSDGFKTSTFPHRGQIIVLDVLGGATGLLVIAMGTSGVY